MAYFSPATSLRPKPTHLHDNAGRRVHDSLFFILYLHLDSVSKKNSSQVIASVIAEIRKQLQSAPEPPPGEGYERHLRTLLRDHLLVSCLGWPPEKLLYGELYDIYGRDLLGYVVVYIETKTPRRPRLSNQEISEFEDKLKRLGTCECGMITNGHQLVSYSVSFGQSATVVTRICEINLDEVVDQCQRSAVAQESLDRLRVAFEGLRPEKYLKTEPVSYAEEYGRIAPARRDKESVRALSSQLRSAIDVLTPVLADTLRTYLTARIQIGPGFRALEPLDDWSTYSGRVPPSMIRKYLEESIEELLELRKKNRINDVVFRRKERESRRRLGVVVDTDAWSRMIADILARPEETQDILEKAVIDLTSSDHIDVFARQTSHVVLSRILLYRVAEDKGLVERRLSGSPLDAYIASTGSGLLDMRMRATAIDALIQSAEDLLASVFYSDLYLHGLFDWWVIPREVREGYNDEHRSIYQRSERFIDIALEKCIRILNRFKLDGIERDVWKDVYQEYLPAKERARLGGFYTPDEIVSYILDLVGYEAHRSICTLTLLDPACGSGTFIIEAANRLRAHLEADCECHPGISSIRDPRQRARAILETLISNLYALDIHPFACFLTEMNFVLSTVDLLMTVKRLDLTFRIDELNVGCDDSLRPPEKHIQQLKLSQFAKTNSRARLMMRDRRKARAIKEASFDIVVGNPPWSGVLRGDLSPLFDENTKHLYRTIYASATDKYDLYVLFLERGIRWLNRGGTLGMITQNRFARRKYGRGMRKFIKEESCSLRSCVDMAKTGKIVFPGRTNYPMVTILQSRKDDNDFLFSETKKPSAGLTLEVLASDIRKGFATLSEKEIYESDHAICYSLPQSRVHGDPEKPWDLSSPEVSNLKKRILTTGASQRLDRIMEFDQGVTPGGGCLDVFLTRSPHDFESDLVFPCVEAEDIVGWKLGEPAKWIIYPYRKDGKKVDLGRLSLDLSQDKAQSEVDGLIARRIIKHPKTAMFLVTHYSRLAVREAEKKSWKDYGKEWYEYHRPRTASVMLGIPKIITRRMTRDIEFSFDDTGFIPTDGCIALTPRKGNDWFRQMRNRGFSDRDALVFCLALLNSSIMKFLIRHSMDSWQGGYYQVRDDTLAGVPVKNPTDRNEEMFKKAIIAANGALEGRAESDETESAILQLYDLKYGSLDR